MWSYSSRLAPWSHSRLGDELDELALAFLRLGRDLEVLLGHPVVEQCRHQGAAVDPVLVDSQRL